MAEHLLIHRGPHMQLRLWRSVFVLTVVSGLCACVSYNSHRTVAASTSSIRYGVLTDVERHAYETTRRLEANPTGTGLKHDTGSAASGSELPCEGCTLQDVWYATDRAPTAPPVLFGSDRSDSLRFGRVVVSFPPRHRLGELERPTTLLGFEFHVDPAEHVALVKSTAIDSDTFGQQIAARVAVSDQRDILVFVHGYRVTFEESVLRTAQLARDLRFSGAPVAYSWPTGNALLGYGWDADSAAFTTLHLESLIRTLATATGARRVHLIAHSMGNRPLMTALANIGRNKTDLLTNIQHVVLTAPDISVDTFRQLVPAIRSVARKITLYASSKDKALMASLAAHFGGQRAGEGGDKLLVVPGVDTIDASELQTTFESWLGLGHSYVYSLALVDLRSLLSDIPPKDRLLNPRRNRRGRYWVAELPR
jgi:esterase/lipase superfamily enzyme